jgi:DNA-binding CsgD family transcriptional regulator
MRGEPDAAAAEVRRRLDVVGEDQLESILLLERIGESEIAKGRDDAAKDRGRRLAEKGAALGCEVAEARGERLWGRALARTNVHAARKHLDAGLSQFIALDMPYEAAQTRLAIAKTVREHEPEVAVVEARAAQNTFEGLGAADGANRSAALLRDLGVKGTRAAPKGLDPLTKREHEVLRLLREGLMNPEIAERLYISRKTVEHHVSSILAKLELNNRTEAAAEAERRLGGESAEK